MSHISDLWKSSVVFGPIFAVLFGVSTSSLFLGFTKYGECPFQPLLPQGLLAFGLIGSTCSIAALVFTVVTFFKVNDSGTHFQYLIYAIIVVGAYGLSAFILALVIAFVLLTKQTELQSENSTDPESFCHASVYNFCYRFAATVTPFASIFFIWLIRYVSNRL